MTWTAIIITFNQPALIGALALATGVLSLSALFLRKRPHFVQVSLLLAASALVLILFSVETMLGVRACSVEVVSYSTQETKS